MYSVLYIGAIIGGIVFTVLLFLFYRMSGRLYGRTLSQWIDRTRKKNDEISAEKLFNIRKKFEALAHDVLKHRLLGLASLIEEIRDELKKTPQLPPEKIDLYRIEFFRLVGLKNGLEERLWTRWQRGIIEIYSYANKNILAPPLDPMFQDTARLLIAMRAILIGFVDDERFDNQFIERITNLPFEKCVSLYPTCIELSHACQMVINPDTIVRRAIDMLTTQAHRGDSGEKIQFYATVNRQLLCPAPTNTLVMCMTRLLDNALNIGDTTALDIEISTDEFTGESFLIIKIYDASEHIPSAGEYGSGLRGIQQGVSSFDGGFQYRLETRDAFKKAAVISFPVSEYADFTVTHQKFYVGVLTTLSLGVIIFGLVFSALYVLGGPPVGFAGKGDNITEFTVAAGEELVIPLCEGGRNVRVETQSVNEVCFADNCSFANVLNALEPCTRSVDDPDCPGEIRWTPQFTDGLRQGKNYELTIHCIAEGMPPSEDLQRIRVIVTRPNSAPKVIVTQLYNETRGGILYVEKNKTLKVGATDKLILRAMAADDDADLITYRLRQPDGQTVVSNDGVFHLKADWSPFATSTFELEISDNIAPPVTIPIILEADKLHPIELRSISLWSKDKSNRVSCDGSDNSRICYITENISNILEVDMWFDPLLPRIRPVIELQIPDNQEGLSIHESETNAKNYTQIGDQWELYLTNNNHIVGFIELINIEKTDVPGLLKYTFNYFAPHSNNELVSLFMNFSVREPTGRLPELNASLFFAKKFTNNDAFSLSTRHISLREYYQDEQQKEALASVWVYPTQGNTSMTVPTIGAITCQNPAFESAFEKPVVRDHHNAWKIDFKLKRGCIPGLSMDLNEKTRLCAVDIQYDSEHPQSNALWMILEPRSCEPSIDELTLVSSKEELAKNAYKWQFHITDTDGDVDINQIDMLGISHYEMIFEKKKDTIGSDYWGFVSFSLECNMPDINHIRQKTAIRVRDKDDHEIIKKINIPLSCDSLVSTPDGQTSFEVDEHTHLEIPLIHDKDVKLTLSSRFGAIIDDKFVWDASCIYGKGPHSVEIRTESASRYGKPFQFDLWVNHCQPHFSLMLDTQPYDTQTPVFLPVGSKRRLTIKSDTAKGDFTIMPGSEAAMPTIQLSEIDSETGWAYDLECDTPGVVETLRFDIESREDQSSAVIDPIGVRVYCLEP